MSDTKPLKSDFPNDEKNTWKIMSPDSLQNQT